VIIIGIELKNRIAIIIGIELKKNSLALE